MRLVEVTFEVRPNQFDIRKNWVAGILSVGRPGAERIGRTLMVKGYTHC